MEDGLCWKTTFAESQPLREDNLWWKTTLIDDELCWKKIFDEKWPFPKTPPKKWFHLPVFPRPYLYCESPLTDLDVALHKDQDKMKL